MGDLDGAAAGGETWIQSCAANLRPGSSGLAIAWWPGASARWPR